MKKKSQKELFRSELIKIMPGYKWTIHRGSNDSPMLEATGIITSGFNRMSTLSVTKTTKEGQIEYTVKSSGLGKYSPWLSEHTDGTLARALRGLQDHYEYMARQYSAHASYLESARQIKEDSGPFELESPK